MLNIKKEISRLLAARAELPPSRIQALLEIPPEPELGDLAFPCFELARVQKRPPAAIAADLAAQLQHSPSPLLKETTSKGAYVNFLINGQYLATILLPEILKLKEQYGCSNEGQGQTVVIDYSAPNIAKPFGIGHLRSTVIGDALYRLLTARGYRCQRINHLGDWGTQFGKLITAFIRWGSDRELQERPINHLYDLYVRFHREQKEQPQLGDEARDWFKKLENGDTTALGLWQRFRDLSLAEFKRIYAMLGIEFDAYQGESFYNDRLAAAIEHVKSLNLVRESDGALIVELDEVGLPPLLLRKKDGATLYATRDLAAACYRYEQYAFDRMLYIVGSEQKLHFQQLFALLKLMQLPWADRCRHIPFGLIRFKDGRMSTREGKTIFLEDVLQRAYELALDIISEKNPDLQNKERAARMVGLGAVKFGDLVNDRIKDVDFDWDKVLDFTGETAPYIQYAHARICSILRKTQAPLTGKQPIVLNEAEEEALVKKLADYPEHIARAVELYKPSVLARYLIELARDFNRFYHNCPVLTVEGAVKQSRLLLCAATRQVLSSGLGLLGIGAPQEM